MLRRSNTWLLLNGIIRAALRRVVFVWAALEMEVAKNEGVLPVARVIRVRTRQHCFGLEKSTYKAVREGVLYGALTVKVFWLGSGLGQRKNATQYNSVNMGCSFAQFLGNSMVTRRAVNICSAYNGIVFVEHHLNMFQKCV